MRVLVAEDDKSSAMMMAIGLPRLAKHLMGDVFVELALDGKEAVELAEAKDFDAAVIDLLMPDMDGREVAGRLRRLPGWMKKKIIILSAIDSPAEVEKSLIAGADYHMAKPVNFSSLIVKLFD